jgi:hypothetical protein
MQNENINILILGQVNTEKTYVANALAKKCAIKNDNINFFVKINDDDKYTCNVEVMDVESNKLSDDNKKVLEEQSSFIDLYVIVCGENNSNDQKVYDTEIIDFISNLIEKNNHGYYFVVVNKKDDILESENISLENVTLLNAKKAYLYRYLYYYDEEMISDTETEKEIENIMKSLIGEITYKKMKNTLISTKSKLEFLNKKFDFESIYEDVMSESGYDDFEEKITNIISANYEKILRKHIGNDIDEITNVESVNNNELIIGISKCAELVEKISEDDFENYEKIVLYITTNLCIILEILAKSPEKISTDIINELTNMNITLNKKWQNNILCDQINGLKIIRNDNLVSIFKFAFDEKILEEIKEKLTVEILHESLLNHVKNINLEQYLSMIERIAEITNNNIEMIATTALFLEKFAKIHVNNYVIGNIIREYVLEETNDKVKYVFLNVMSKLAIQSGKNTILLCVYNDYIEGKKIINEIYETIKDIFDIEKYENIESSSQIKKYICDIDQKYKNMSSSLLSNFTKKMISNYVSVYKIIQFVDKQHKNNLLEYIINNENSNGNLDTNDKSSKSKSKSKIIKKTIESSDDD